MRMLVIGLGLLLISSGAEAQSSFEAGAADRNAWEDWVGSTKGSVEAGALWWAEHRTDRPAPSCSNGPANDGAWAAGCSTARARIAPYDYRRNADPDYRAGWNSVPDRFPGMGREELNPPAAAPYQSPSYQQLPSQPPGRAYTQETSTTDQAKTENSAFYILVFLGIISVALYFYFLPTIIASKRGNPQTGYIFILNLLFGATVVGWVAAFIWACVTPRREVAYRRGEWIDDGEVLPAAGRRSVRSEPRLPPVMKICPECAEEIQPAARVCRFCGYSFVVAGGAR